MTKKTCFLDGWSWFKFNNLGLTLGKNLKFYTSVAKELKLKVRTLWGIILTFVEVTGEKLVGWSLCPPLPRPPIKVFILNKMLPDSTKKPINLLLNNSYDFSNTYGINIRFLISVLQRKE